VAAWAALSVCLSWAMRVSGGWCGCVHG
jgi:hypothetical protein